MVKNTHSPEGIQLRMTGQGSNSLDPQDLFVKRPVSQHCAKIYIQIKLKAVCKKMWLNTIKTKGEVNKEQIYGSYISYSVSVQDLRVQSCHPLQTARQEYRTYIVGHMLSTLKKKTCNFSGASRFLLMTKKYCSSKLEKSVNTNK